MIDDSKTGSLGPGDSYKSQDWNRGIDRELFSFGLAHTFVKNKDQRINGMEHEY